MMIGLPRLMGTLAILPATILLTISFFVLVVLRKVEREGLKAFGYVVAALLWISALLVFSMGIYVLSKGKHPMMMGGMKCSSPQMIKGPMMDSMMMHNSQGEQIKAEKKGR
ncbi:MAG: hypothetical protein V2A59_05245 [Candidatus Omnitrophota bacterium]